MLTGTFRELFAAIATSAGSLTGLLFVVVTVRESRTAQTLPSVIQQVRAAAALLSFTNALAVSLFGLVPGDNVGYPAVALGVIGITFSAGAFRSVLIDPTTKHRRQQDSVLTVILLLAFTAELLAGIYLLRDPHNTGPLGLGLISYVLVASLLIGIARAWELVGGRDIGIFASLAALTKRPPQYGGIRLPDPLKSTNKDKAKERPKVESEAD